MKCFIGVVGIALSAAVADAAQCRTSLLTGEEIDGYYEELDAVDGGYHWLPLLDDFIQSLTVYEAPLRFRIVANHAQTVYSAVAMVDDVALDVFGSGERRICQGELTGQQFFRLGSLTSVYTFAYSASQLSPATKKAMEEKFGVDRFTLIEEAKVDDATPWGLAKAYVSDFQASMENDGWNADGSLSAEFNKVPFEDYAKGSYEKYEVQNDFESWQPLEESDGNGYFTRQGHITPFIGYNVRLMGLSREEFNNMTIPSPTFYGYSNDYVVEAKNVLQTTRRMATNDTKKVLVEYFDSKITSIFMLQLQWARKERLGELDLWFQNMAMATVMYDAVLLAWREKVSNNRIRPKTIVERIIQDQKVLTYAGPFNGAQQISGLDWQPYVRTGPHSEFPSGSACICSSFSEVMALLTGRDGIRIPLIANEDGFKKHSSMTEPGFTPSEDINIEFTTWSSIAQMCGQSRLDGGMHFDGSVPAGFDLCTNNIAPAIFARANMLKNGNAMGTFVIEDTGNPGERDNIPRIPEAPIKNDDNEEGSKISLPSAITASIGFLLIGMIAGYFINDRRKPKHPIQTKSVVLADF